MSDAAPQSDERGQLRSATSAVADSTPVSVVAQQILQRQLRKVRKRIRKLAEKSHTGPTSIHRFRVAIRRSEAALLTFRPLAPRGRTHRLRKRLRRLRRLAGEIRDVDVFLEFLSREAVLGPATAEQSSCRKRRDGLVDQFCRRALHEQQRGLADDIRDVVIRIRWRDKTPEPSFAAVAPALLGPVAHRCLAAAGESIHDIRQLHRFRIQVKRLRYACEFLQAGLDHDASAALLAELSQLQQQLGEICDRAATVRFLKESAAKVPGGEAALNLARQNRDAKMTTFTDGWERNGRERFRRVVAACLK